MSFIFNILTLSESFILGYILVNLISIEIPKPHKLFYYLSLGTIIFTIINYLLCLFLGFPTGVTQAHGIILFLEISFFLLPKRYSKRTSLAFLYQEILSLLKEPVLLLTILLITSLSIPLLNSHMLYQRSDGLYTGESTYGDLPFHLSTISQIAYGYKFPPENPFFVGLPLAYPFLINFFSAILAYEGMSLRYSLIIPGLFLIICTAGLIYDFSFFIIKKKTSAILSVLIYFLNGGLGFFFFLKDYSFNLSQIINALSNPSSLKEYSHLFSENIQWANFLTRMVIPERSLLFGLPAGLIILRLLFFNNKEKNNYFDILIIAFLIAFMPLLHSHTVLTLFFILPIFILIKYKKFLNKTYLYQLIFLFILIAILALPIIPLFLNHLGWMVQDNESYLWFWIKNTYLYIPLSLLCLIFTKNNNLKIIQIAGLFLLIPINTFYFSPYDWDNVKFLLWSGIFFSIGASYIISKLFAKKSFLILGIILLTTILSSATLSYLREINISYQLFSNDGIIMSNKVKEETTQDSIFLTYKIHNSPISNLAGRSILMGYPGSLWVHGIDYSQRENEINQILRGEDNALNLIDKYHIKYIVLEKNDPEDIIINRTFLEQFPKSFKNDNYTILKTY